MTDRRRRSEKLVNDIRSALERGVSRDRIHAALVGRNVPADKAKLLLDSILAARSQPVPVPILPAAPEPAAIAMPRRRRGRAPFFLAFAVALLAVGFAGVFRPTPEPANAPVLPDPALEVARLDGEVVSARAHIAHIETRLEARKVDAEQIEWLRARVARGPASFDTDDDYRDMVGIYERRRARWNRTLPDYQVVAGALRLMVDIHNAKLDSLTALAGPSHARAASPVRYARIATTVPAM